MEFRRVLLVPCAQPGSSDKVKPDHSSGTRSVKRLPTYPSLRACVASTGIPLAELRNARTRGCPGVRANGTVNLGEFLAWYWSGSATPDQETIEDAERRKVVAEADLKEILRAKSRKELVPVDDVARWAENVAVSLRQGILSATELTERSRDELLVNLQRLTRQATMEAAEQGPDEPAEANAGQ